MMSKLPLSFILARKNLSQMSNEIYQTLQVKSDQKASINSMAVLLKCLRGVTGRRAARARRGAARRGRYALVYSGTIIYDRSKLRGFTARLYWPATDAPALSSRLHSPSITCFYLPFPTFPPLHSRHAYFSF